MVMLNAQLQEPQYRDIEVHRFPKPYSAARNGGTHSTSTCPCNDRLPNLLSILSSPPHYRLVALSPQPHSRSVPSQDCTRLAVLSRQRSLTPCHILYPMVPWIYSLRFNSGLISPHILHLQLDYTPFPRLRSRLAHRKLKSDLHFPLTIG